MPTSPVPDPIGGRLVDAPASRNTLSPPLSGLFTGGGTPPELRERDEHPTTEAGARADWTPIDERMPPEGVVVETDAPGGRLRLKWQGRLWRFPDESYYLFHTPRYWRPLAGPVPEAPRPAPPAARGIGRGLLAVFGWIAGAGATALAADLLMAPAPTARQVALAVALAALGMTLLFGGACGRGLARPA